MSNYTKATDFAAKDALITGNPAKVIKGIDINTEFVAIETAIATKYDSATLGASGGGALIGYLPQGTGAVATTVQAKLRESVSILDFGGVSGADCTAAFTAAFAALASGGKLYLPPGTWQTTGGHTVPQRVSIVGAGMGVSIIQHTSANNVLFNQPLVGGNETTVEYGGNVYQGFTAYGTSAANTATAIKIKNKVNIKFDHVELYDFGTLVAGVRDNVANSVNSVLFNGIRFGACVTAINAPLAWNGVTIQGASQFFSSTGWTIINYDSANWNIDASTTFTANQTGTGHIYFGGCTGWVVNAYFEGNPTIGYYFSARSQKDKDGNATNGGIAIGYVRSGTMQGMTARSAGGTSYVVHLDATSCVVATGCHAGSGINVSFAYVTTGTRSNSFIGCYSNPGTVATFQTAADADYNIVQNYLTGSLSASKAFPTAPVVVGGTSAGASTGGTQTGYYCRVGDVCHFTVSVNWTSHTGTGQLRINNLPFTSNANTVQTFSARVATTSAGDTTQITGFIPAGSTQLRLEKYAAGGVTDLAIPGAGNFVISGSYLL